MFERFTEKARRVIVLAQESARNLDSPDIGTEHILLGLISEEMSTQIIFAEYGVTTNAVIDVLETLTNKKKPTGGHIPFTPDAKKALEGSLREALQLGDSYIGCEHIGMGLARVKSGKAVAIFRALNVDVSELRKSLLGSMSANSSDKEEGAVTIGTRGSSDDTSRNTGNLEKYGTDLTQMAREGNLDPVIGRDDEVDRVIQILSRRTKNNPVLVGEPGVGKTAIVDGLAQRIVSGDVPAKMKNMTVFSLDMGLLVSGTRYRGDFEERMTGLLSAAKRRDDLIIFIDEIHTLVTAGSAEGAIDAASILKPALARGEIRTIGATTLDEYRKHVEKDAALERRFQQVTVAEPSEEATIKILRGLRDQYEDHHEITITDEAIHAAVKMSSRYVTDRFLPDKAIDLLDEAGSKLCLSSPAESGAHSLDADIEDVAAKKEKAIDEQDFETAAYFRTQEKDLVEERAALLTNITPPTVKVRPALTESLIADVLAKATGVPVTKLTEDETTRLMNLEIEIQRRVVGQSQAVNHLAKSIRRARAGLHDPNRPSGSFIFAGSTGVGKTELAKALANYLFGSDDALITLDMSEYGEKHSVSRIFGAPPGYVGYEEGGQLTEMVRRRPFSVVLFDEIEKAHPDIFNSLLQVLEEGRLTDGQGREINFKNTIIIMTTNLGTGKTTQGNALGFSRELSTEEKYQEMKARVISDLRDHFRPEFLNRVDDTIVFQQLQESDTVQIVDLFINKTSIRLAHMGIALTVTDDAKRELARRGYSELFGARPLRRTVQNDLEDPISEHLLTGTLLPGQTMLVGWSDAAKDFTFSPIGDDSPHPVEATASSPTRPIL